MIKVAVIGSGISGLAAAWLLSRTHEVSVFEAEQRVGGHTHTMPVQTAQGPVAVDTGFIVHNRVNYPHLCRLFDELGVTTTTSDMSFAVHERDTGFTWSSRGLNGLFADRRNLWRPSFYRFAAEVLRFNRAGRQFLAGPRDLGVTLDGFLAREGFSPALRQRYIGPMAAAIWSTPNEEIGEFPAWSLLSFLDNHGMLGVTTQFEWRTIQGGCARYIEPLTRPFRERIHQGCAVRRIQRDETGVTISGDGFAPRRFDAVVLACHGDQVLPLLAAPTAAERAVFGAFRSTRNDTWLHTDPSILPRRRRAWASWNHLRATGREGRLCLTYHMNRLQPLPTTRDIFVSLNALGLINDATVHARLVYEHPRFDAAAVLAQSRWSEVSGHHRTHYCGAYWMNGFHEDGLNSARRVAAACGVVWP